MLFDPFRLYSTKKLTHTKQKENVFPTHPYHNHHHEKTKISMVLFFKPDEWFLSLFFWCKWIWIIYITSHVQTKIDEISVFAHKANSTMKRARALQWPESVLVSNPYSGTMLKHIKTFCIICFLSCTHTEQHFGS